MHRPECVGPAQGWDWLDAEQAFEGQCGGAMTQRSRLTVAQGARTLPWRTDRAGDAGGLPAEKDAA